MISLNISIINIFFFCLGLFQFLEPRSLRPTFLETVRADSLIPMPPQMEDAIFGVNSDFYIREVSQISVWIDQSYQTLFINQWQNQ